MGIKVTNTQPTFKVGAWGEVFPAGSVVKSPPANTRDMGSIPGPGRSHTSQGN